MVARYRSFVEDNTRWDRFVFRPGDIVISTPRKCGTTWTQLLCALLIFDGDSFPAPLSRLSPWLDQRTASTEDVLAAYEGQRHRRIVKTHTPLDGLPVLDKATYVVVGRDPRDVVISMDHHRSNMDYERLRTIIRAAGGDVDDAGVEVPTPPDMRDPDARLRAFVDGTDPWAPITLHSLLHHLDTAWQRRTEPNIAMFHFADYSTDLSAELLRLAAVLDIPLTGARARELAPLASFDRSRRRAADIAPNADIQLWKDTAEFFRAGRVGGWEGRFSAEELDHYAAVVSASFDPDLAAWAHRGRIGSGIDPNQT